ncbi:uncharacterized protein PV07_09390 [Cladophialophora immunda]|uniref:Cytochrome c oxidase-assembly factor COX23, mitochondrial n=1 Tax=Cladophialophora immunda TaxID=569365 RepID=A0A0D2AME8_9EURO|nr:uncharacterized protein PV07_09390 [Cladophialophora immunda]KIW26282.1 hypothetical protein PV07_09390 [Cladophialophora immunda]
MATSAQSDQAASSEPQSDAWEKSKATFQGKRSSEYYDPCQEFANKSIKCMHRNKGDREMCQDYFKCVSPFATGAGPRAERDDNKPVFRVVWSGSDGTASSANSGLRDLG